MGLNEFDKVSICNAARGLLAVGHLELEYLVQGLIILLQNLDCLEYIIFFCEDLSHINLANFNITDQGLL